MRFTPQCRALDWLIARPIAHRGLHAAGKNVIENSESAFAAAIAGNYAIECDLQISADGEAMVFHDDVLDRLIDAEGPVQARSAKELKTLPYKQGKDRIQTLAELCEQTNGRVTLVIELKSHWDGNTGLAIRTLQVLEHYNGPYALMSFDPELVAAVADYSPRTIRGITADRCVDDYYKALPFQRRLSMQQFAHLHRTRPHFVSYYFRDLPFEPVQNLRAAGLPIISWTIKSEEQAAEARRYSDQITFERFLA